MQLALIKVGAVSAICGGLAGILYEVINFVLGYPEAGRGDAVASTLKAIRLPFLALAAVALSLWLG